MRRALAVAGLGLGDEGKGSVVDWLVRRTRAASTLSVSSSADASPISVVRYNGGPQAAHHVVTVEGVTFCFAQLGAGSLVPGVRTFLSRFMVVCPLALVAEERALCTMGVSDGFARLDVDPRALVVTPYHAALNRMRELARGAARHGSCGRGVAEAQLDAERGLPQLHVGDLGDRARTRRILSLMWRLKLDLAEQLAQQAPGLREALADLRERDRLEPLVDAYERFVSSSGVRLTEGPAGEGALIFEGAQGVLLDREHGFWPHVTPSRTTFENALELARELGVTVEKVGVLRAYATRHGAGPLPTEDSALVLPDAHNGDDPWQGGFRVGWLDAPATRHALAIVGGVDRLVLTCVDRLAPLERVRVCTAYRGESGALRDLPFPVEDRAQLVNMLGRCTPVYEELPGRFDEASFLALVAGERGLALPIDAISRGPTARDKQVLSRWEI